MKTSPPKAQGPLTAEPYCVLLADDHAVVRMGLKVLIGKVDKNTLVDEMPASDGIVTRLRARRYDLLILDINIRQTESFSLIASIRLEFPLLKILIYTINDELVFGKRFLRWGVNGYLQKKTAESEIVTALREVRAGRIYLSDALSRMICGPESPQTPRTPFDHLTDREFEITLQLLRGNSPEAIAAILHMNRSTVGTHKSRILRKLNVQNTGDLLVLASRYHLV
jgi:DNA-binding NarL/FixJ family response regulator